MTEKEVNKKSLNERLKGDQKHPARSTKVTEDQKKVINDIIEKYNEVLKVLAK